MLAQIQDVMAGCFCDVALSWTLTTLIYLFSIFFDMAFIKKVPVVMVTLYALWLQLKLM